MNKYYKIASLLISITFILSSCCYYPRKVEFYDEECQIESKKLVLEATLVNMTANCQNEECIIALLVPGVASAVVSGSIVIVGNVVYWLERQGKCLPKRFE
ncbi:MAG: hypothetical protein IME96_11235 [Proteobacteria bacterium]|nr:hypothetical protein [Pseudomonadota bacterium]